MCLCVCVFVVGLCGTLRVRRSAKRPTSPNICFCVMPFPSCLVVFFGLVLVVFDAMFWLLMDRSMVVVWHHARFALNLLLDICVREIGCAVSC